MNAEDITWEKYTCIYTGYILSQRRAVFVRLCGTIKHRERQSRTLFLSRITTHIDMTYLRLPRQNTWEMQLVTTWDLKYPTMFMIFTLNLKFLHRRDFFNKHSDTYQPWIRLVPILFLFCDRQYLYIGETEKSLQKGFLFKTVSANSDGRGRTFVKVVYQKFNGQFTLACGPAVLDT